MKQASIWATTHTHPSMPTQTPGGGAQPLSAAQPRSLLPFFFVRHDLLQRGSHEAAAAAAAAAKTHSHCGSAGRQARPVTGTADKKKWNDQKGSAKNWAPAYALRRAYGRTRRVRCKARRQTPVKTDLHERPFPTPGKCFFYQILLYSLRVASPALHALINIGGSGRGEGGGLFVFWSQPNSRAPGGQAGTAPHSG